MYRIYYAVMIFLKPNGIILFIHTPRVLKSDKNLQMKRLD